LSLETAADNPKETNLVVTYSPSDALDNNDNATEIGELLQPIIPDREVDRRHQASEFATIPTERHLLPPYYLLPINE